MDHLIYASLSHTHYWYEVGILKLSLLNPPGQEHGRIKYETLLEIITARDVRRAYAFRQQTANEGADMDELFTGIDTSARKRDFGGTLVRRSRRTSTALSGITPSAARLPTSLVVGC